jgi:hypothetical protein
MLHASVPRRKRSGVAEKAAINLAENCIASVKNSIRNGRLFAGLSQSVLPKIRPLKNAFGINQHLTGADND